MIKSATNRTRLLNGRVPIHFREAGEGASTLVFVHGNGSHLGVWNKNIEVLGRYYRCLALDWPGAGLSPEGDYPYSMNFLTDVLLDFLDRHDARHCVPIGHSMGGQVLLTAALRAPDRFERMVLAAPAGFEPFSDRERAMLIQYAQSGFQASSDSMKARLKRQMSAYNPEMALDLEQLDLPFVQQPHYERTVKAGLMAMLQQPVFEHLDELKPEVLVLYGTEDRLIPNRLLHQQTTTEVAQTAVARIPRARLQMLPDCGHYVPYEQPQRFNLETYKFLNPKIFR